MDNVSHIDTGFGGWQNEGLPIQHYDEWRASQGS